MFSLPPHQPDQLVDILPKAILRLFPDKCLLYYICKFEIRKSLIWISPITIINKNIIVATSSNF